MARLLWEQCGVPDPIVDRSTGQDLPSTPFHLISPRTLNRPHPWRRLADTSRPQEKRRTSIPVLGLS